MRLSIVSPAPGYPGTSGVLAVYCRGFVHPDVPAGGEHVRGCGGGSSADIPAGRGPCTGLRRWLERKRPGRVGTMYGVAAVARWCSFGPGIWAGISSGMSVGACHSPNFIAGNCSRELAAWYGGRDFVRDLTNSPVVWWPGLRPRLKSSPVVWGPGLSR